MCSPRRRSSAWICWALQNPGRLSSAATSAAACRVPRTLVPRGRPASAEVGCPASSEAGAAAGSDCEVVTTARYRVGLTEPNRNDYHYGHVPQDRVPQHQARTPADAGGGGHRRRDRQRLLLG